MKSHAINILGDFCYRKGYLLSQKHGYSPTIKLVERMMKRVEDTFTIVDKPEEYSCRVWRYTASHSKLLIQAHRGDITEGDLFYLLFSAVSYYEGPVGWLGANFRLSSKQEHLDLFNQLGWGKDDDLEIESYLHYNKLYIFGEGSESVKSIKILAGILQEMKEPPEELSFSW